MQPESVGTGLGFELTRHKRPEKRQKIEKPVAPDGVKIIAQFQNQDHEHTGPPLNIPVDITPDQLTVLLNSLLENEDPMPYSFFVDDREIFDDFYQDIIHAAEKSTEEKFMITYQPQAVFKVRTVTRCSSSLNGHTEAVLSVCFSPDGKYLATGSGDTTVRIWDLSTETPRYTLKGHTNWVQHVAWSPDCQILVSGGMDSTVRVWNPNKGTSMGDGMKGHRNCITSIAFEPMHLNKNCNRFVTTSKDCTTRIWDAKTRKCEIVLSQHTMPVTCVKWGGDGLIYTGSRDKTIKVWDSKTGTLIRNLLGHAHWVNHLCLSTDFITRTGPFDHTDPKFSSNDEMHARALERYNEFIKKNGKERMASGSDDFTIYLWEQGEKKPIGRMTGHHQPVTHLSFSPDGTVLASACFDKSVKLWDGKSGKFKTTLKGHVGAVYQVCWSSDSRQILSGSRDSTLKVWDLKTGLMKAELPGHSDEVFSVDWSPSGDKVASGGKDKVLKM